MAESTSVALAATTIPTSAEIARAEKLVRERFVHDGEDPAVALAPGSPRRRALDQALAELAENPKAKTPSTAWRREFSLLLGLERLLSEDEPKLVDGTVLSAHQVDALSGTLTALLAEAQRTAPEANGRAAASASPELLASADILGPEEGLGGRGRRGGGRPAHPGRGLRARTTRTSSTRRRTRRRTTRTTSSARSSGQRPRRRTTRTWRTRTRRRTSWRRSPSEELGRRGGIRRGAS